MNTVQRQLGKVALVTDVKSEITSQLDCSLKSLAIFQNKHKQYIVSVLKLSFFHPLIF